MPELPEVETTCKGIAPHIAGQRISNIILRNANLRYRVSDNFKTDAIGSVIDKVERRAKYILLRTASGTMIIHLGMSGNLRVVQNDVPYNKHDHVDIIFDNSLCLRLHDPRRFGCVIWTQENPKQHKLLKDLGIEPFDSAFNGNLLFACSRGKKITIKQFIMDGRIVVGVGNIYASEALFLAGIDPRHPAGRVSKSRYEKLASTIQSVLREAIESGGTTLRDFLNGDGKPGYFQQRLRVYGREGESCLICSQPINQQVLGQRASYFCRYCQT